MTQTPEQWAKERDARTRLEAAAPKMLEALQAILPLAEEFLRNAPSHPDNAKLEDARAAIKEATGE